MRSRHLPLACAALALSLPAPSSAMDKTQVFERAAPATVLIVVPAQKGLVLGTGAILGAGGLVVTNHHVIESAGGGGEVLVFLRESSERVVDEDFGVYLNSHKDKALRARVLRVDTQNDLALLQLPHRALPYPALVLGDSDAVKVGQDVVAIGNPQGLGWTQTTGSISAIRKSTLQTDAAINHGNSGGPLLDMEARLIGINTYIRGDGQSLGFARQSNVVKAFIAGSIGLGQIVASSTSHGQGGVPAPSLAPSAVMGPVMKTVLDALTRQVGRRQALVVSCSLLSASTFGGKVAVSCDGDQLNAAIAEALSRSGAATGAARKFISESFPIVAAAKQQVWRRQGTKYLPIGAAQSWAVDDATGAILAIGPEHKLLSLDGKSGRFVDTGVGGVRDVEASAGTIYLLRVGGGLVARRAAVETLLTPSTVNGALRASGGVLYVLDPAHRLFRHTAGGWDPGKGPLAENVARVAVNGALYYTVDTAGNVYSGAEGRVIDRDGDAQLLWTVGRDLLMYSKGDNLFYYEAAARKWRPIGD